MTRSNHRRARLGGLIATALGALALLAMPGVAAAKDRNHDHIPDRWEVRHHLSLRVNQAHRDQDHDQLVNLAEFRAGDNPRDPDSDDNGVMDGEENAGTIASFDAATGKLTINLFGGESISGQVTESTEIECRETGAGASTSGDEESGEDHGEEQGDDNGDENPGEDDNGPGGNCTVADLLPGAMVHEAELQLGNGAGTFDKIELGG
jgi:hypothetical protein